MDPDRDSPERMKKFLSYFGNSFIGVTGLNNDDPKLREMMRKFKIYSTKIEYELENKEKSYTLDHTVISYLMNREN